MKDLFKTIKEVYEQKEENLKAPRKRNLEENLENLKVPKKSLEEEEENQEK